MVGVSFLPKAWYKFRRKKKAGSELVKRANSRPAFTLRKVTSVRLLSQYILIYWALILITWKDIQSEVPFYPLLPDIRKSIVFLGAPEFVSLFLMVWLSLRLRWAYSISGIVLTGNVMFRRGGGGHSEKKPVRDTARPVCVKCGIMNV